MHWRGRGIWLGLSESKFQKVLHPYRNISSLCQPFQHWIEEKCPQSTLGRRRTLFQFRSAYLLSKCSHIHMGQSGIGVNWVSWCKSVLEVNMPSSTVTIKHLMASLQLSCCGKSLLKAPISGSVQGQFCDALKVLYRMRCSVNPAHLKYIFSSDFNFHYLKW